jgi:hypothetical protein
VGVSLFPFCVFCTGIRSTATNDPVNDRLMRVFGLPTDAQENCFKKNFKIYINR